MPHNEWYYHTAYIVALAIYTAYTISLWWRKKKLAERAAALETREESIRSA
jgi:hypothetical protein